MKLSRKLVVYVLSVALVSALLGVPSVSAHPEGMVFPVIGNTNYSDTFLAYRAGQVENKHHAIDIFGAKHSTIVSPIDGTVRFCQHVRQSEERESAQGAWVREISWPGVQEVLDE